MSPHTAFPCKILNGMMTLRHDDMMTLRPDCMPVNRCCAGGLFVGSRREAQGWHPVFFGKLQRILFKSPPPSRRILTKIFTKTFTKLSPNFHQLSPNFHQKGQKGVKNGLTFTFSFTSFHPSPFFLAALKDSPTFAPSVETNEAR